MRHSTKPKNIRRGIMFLLVNCVILILAAWILPGIKIDGIISALLVTLALALINLFVRPFIVSLTLPITFLTLGLFLLFIDVIIIYLAAFIIPGFHITGFWSAFFLGVILSIFGTVLD